MRTVMQNMLVSFHKGTLHIMSGYTMSFLEQRMLTCAERQDAVVLGLKFQNMLVPFHKGTLPIISGYTMSFLEHRMLTCAER
ncbi:hypothetical protein SUGI_0546760 [Cryptomeria japonica]|nr:hypothetical protein SUGI_0546760 [Cryptomeria japonica]